MRSVVASQMSTCHASHGAREGVDMLGTELSFIKLHLNNRQLHVWTMESLYNVFWLTVQIAPVHLSILALKAKCKCALC